MIDYIRKYRITQNIKKYGWYIRKIKTHAKEHAPPLWGPAAPWALGPAQGRSFVCVSLFSLCIS